MDRGRQGVISVLEVAQSTLHEFVDMQMKFCSECESINLDEVRTVSEEEEDRAKKMDGLKKKHQYELEQSFNRLFYHAALADSELECARFRLAVMQNQQRSTSRSRSRARAGKGNDKDDGKGKHHGTHTAGIGNGKGSLVDATAIGVKGGEDSDVNVCNQDWLEEEANSCMRQYMGRDVAALVRLSLRRGLDKGLGQRSPNT